MPFAVKGCEELTILSRLLQDLARTQDSFAGNLRGEFFGHAFNSVVGANERVY